MGFTEWFLLGAVLMGVVIFAAFKRKKGRVLPTAPDEEDDDFSDDDRPRQRRKD